MSRVAGRRFTVSRVAARRQSGIVWGATIGAIVGVALSVLGLIVDRSQFFQSYLAAFIWGVGLTAHQTLVLLVQPAVATA